AAPCRRHPGSFHEGESPRDSAAAGRSLWEDAPERCAKHPPRQSFPECLLPARLLLSPGPAKARQIAAWKERSRIYIRDKIDDVVSFEFSASCSLTQGFAEFHTLKVACIFGFVKRARQASRSTGPSTEQVISERRTTSAAGI